MGRQVKGLPTPKIADMFRIVNLLPSGIVMKDEKELASDFYEKDECGFRPAIEESYHNWIYSSEFDCDKSLLPKEVYEDMYRDYLIEYYTDEGKVWVFYAAKALAECFADLPKAFVEYVNIPNTEVEFLTNRLMARIKKNDFGSEEVREKELEADDKIRAAVDRYNKARDFYNRLYELAKAFERCRRFPYKAERIFDEYDGGFPSIELFSARKATVEYNRLKILPDEFTEAFDGVDIDRVKICGHCKKVFWAKRQTMKGCSKSCAKILRTKKWREKTTKEQRQKYYENRVLKEIRNQKNKMERKD
ncbi:MAG: hypothetical protein JSS81_30030 [Acidobacteria bacterium]|nr:hypothetical protein [Acidobacteriota bacterium]